MIGTVGYAEGLGRLACISFGCCYGVALREAHPSRDVFSIAGTLFFSGSMKKISSASGLEWKQVIQIQALTGEDSLAFFDAID